MKVTIITATKNDAITIERTIKSVLSQTYGDIDYIVVVGDSNDNTLKIALNYEKRDNRIRVVSENDSGVYEAINNGISVARGDIIGLLHGNDFFTNDNVVSSVVGKFENSDTDLIYGDVHFENSGGRAVRYYSAKDFTNKKLLIGIAPPHPSLYVKRSIYEKFGLYKEDYLIGADFEMFVRLLMKNELKSEYLPMDMVTMSLGGLSTRLYHRIVTNNREKYRALRENSIKVCRLSLFKRYFYNFKKN